MRSFFVFLKSSWWIFLGFAFLSLSLFSPFARREVEDCRKLYEKAKAFYQHGKIDDSLYALRLVASSFPYCALAPRALLISAHLYHHHYKDREEARTIALLLTRRYRDTPFAHYAQVYLDKNTRTPYKKLLASYPSREILFQQIQLKSCAELKEFWEIGDAYLASLFLERTEPPLLFYQAKKEKCRGGKGVAALFHRILTLAPEGSELTSLARLELADFFFQQKKLKESLHYLIPPSEFFFSYYLAGIGDTKMLLGKYQEAEEAYNEAHGLTSAHPFFSALPPPLQKIRLYYRTGRKEEAEKARISFFSSLLSHLAKRRGKAREKAITEINAYSQLLAEDLLELDLPAESVQVLKQLILPQRKKKVSRQLEKSLLLALRLFWITGEQEGARKLYRRLADYHLQDLLAFKLHSFLLYPQKMPSDFSWVKEALARRHPFSFFGYYAYIRMKQQIPGNAFPPYVYRRIEAQIAKTYRTLLLHSLRSSPAKDFAFLPFTYDLYWQSGEYEKALKALPPQGSKGAALYFSFIRTRSPKPANLYEARSLAKKVLALEAKITHPTLSYPEDLLAYLRLLHREDELPFYLTQHLSSFPALAFRFYKMELDRVLKPWETKYQRNDDFCFTEEEKQSLRKAMWLLSLYRLEHLPARRSDLEKELGTELSDSFFQELTSGLLYPSPPPQVRQFHEQIEEAFSLFAREADSWQAFCASSSPAFLSSPVIVPPSELLEAWKKVEEVKARLAP